MKHLRAAFTLMELIFVIVLVGILSATAVFYFRPTDTELVQATNQLARHIRYTQHLALMDDRFDPDPKNPNSGDWFIARWQIRFDHNHKGYYAIFSNRGDYTGGEPDSDKEIAIDPYDKAQLGRSSVAAIAEKEKSITYLPTHYNTTISGISCGDPNSFYFSQNSVSFVFDTIGRPYVIPRLYNTTNYQNPYTDIQKASCTITLEHLETHETKMITIHPESGFVEIN